MDYFVQPRMIDNGVIITKFKQPHVAIGLARLTGVPLNIIGGDRFVDDPAYVSLVKNFLE